jgi:hypothetical protein
VGEHNIQKHGNVLKSPGRTNNKNVQTSPHEFLSLLGRFHERLNDFFKDMRTLPEPAERHTTGAARRSPTSK